MTALVSAVAVSPRRVEVGFDGAVVSGPGAKARLVPESVPAVTCASSALTIDGDTAAVELDREMSPGATYEISLEDLLDDAGQSLTSQTIPVTGFRPRAPLSRRFDLWSLLPRENRHGDVTGDLWRFIACFQDPLDLILADLGAFTDIFDPERCPERYLDLILWDRGNPFSFPMSADEKRRLAAVLGDIFEWKGTDAGIENAIRFFIATEAKVVPYADEALILGESELGIDWILGASSEFARYAFDIEVGRILTGDEQTKLRAIVQFAKPAPTHFMRLIEPIPPPTVDHWVLGESLIGVTTILH
jgi:phage tail-like protein